MQKIIAGNWKMNGSQALAEALASGVASFCARSGVKGEVILCPPSILLTTVGKRLQGSFVALGGQDVSAQESGAYTGDISALMLKEAGCRYTIIGHSERRQLHAETDAQVAAKAQASLKQGLKPIICVGETLSEREAGRANAVVASQLAGSVPAGTKAGDFVLAYEPVWAIGSGKVPSGADIADMHAHIKSLVTGANVLYGGSVKADNAREIMRIAGVDGVLVGGASLVLDEFCGIIAASEE